MRNFHVKFWAVLGSFVYITASRSFAVGMGELRATSSSNGKGKLGRFDWRIFSMQPQAATNSCKCRVCLPWAIVKIPVLGKQVRFAWRGGNVLGKRSAVLNLLP